AVGERIREVELLAGEREAARGLGVGPCLEAEVGGERRATVALHAAVPLHATAGDGVDDAARVDAADPEVLLIDDVTLAPGTELERARLFEQRLARRHPVAAETRAGAAL